jgi:LysR family transcriptional regulator, nod-box dependent transcriptional activator
MRLRDFDLNLLIALDALLSEQSTTRAGKRLNLSQSALSCSLGRLRDYFQDDVLMQTGRELTPTQLGRSLAGPVRELLLQAEALLESSRVFDPVVSERHFVLLMSDYASSVLMVKAAQHIARTAPHISFELLPQVHLPWESLDSGEVDLLMMPEQFLSPDHPREPLYEDHYIGVVWSGHPEVGERISTEQFESLGHVMARIDVQRRQSITIEESALKRAGLKRRVECVVSEFNAIPQYLIGTTRMAMMHARLAALHCATGGLRTVQLPYEFPTVNEALQWHRHRDQDPGLSWLRAVLRSAAADLGPGTAIRARPAAAAC